MNTLTQQDGASQRRVGSVKAAIEILRYLEAARSGVGVNALARALGLSPSSCFNLLKTLADEQFLDFDPHTKLYTLGPGAISLGRVALDPAGAFAIARQRLERLAVAHQVTAAVWRLSRGEQLFLVGFAESEATTRIHLSVGQRLPIAAGAAGRCALAFSELDARAIAERLRAVKWAHPPTLAAYERELEETRSRGWAIDEGRFVHGVTTLAAPVLDSQGTLQICVTATTFTGQHSAAELEKIAEHIHDVGHWLSDRMYAIGIRPSRRAGGKAAI